MRIDAALEPTSRKLSARKTELWAMLAERVVDECHPEQRDFVLDIARYIVALVGRGGGKTTGGRARFLRRMLTVAKSQCLFVARTKDHAKGLIWKETQASFTALGLRAGVDVVYNQTTLTATLAHNGSSLHLVGADKISDLDSLRGITFHEIGIDEAASHPDKLLSYLIKEVLGPRLHPRGSLWLIGTAGKRLSGQFYEVSRKGSKLSRPWKERDAFPGWKLWSFHKWTIESAIEATKDRPVQALLDQLETNRLEIASHGYSEDNPIKRREYDAEWAADETLNVYRYRVHDEDGRLWNQWDPPREGPLSIAVLPAGLGSWIHAVTMDPGYTDPTAINVFSLSLDDPTRTIYHRLGMEQTEMWPQLVAHALVGEAVDLAAPAGIIGAIGSWPSVMVADTAHQMAMALLAELLNVYSIHVEPAQKGFRYKVGAIDVVNGDLVDGRIKVLKGSKLEEQLLDLQWDEGKNGEQIERRGAPNHSTDCLVYGRAALSEYMSAVPPPAQQPKPLDPRAPGYVPPLPQAPDENDLAHLLGTEDDYAALLGG
jgi:hypothetical protein